MDNEMIERCASAIIAAAYKTGGVYLSAGIGKAAANDVIKAMREPTEKMLKYGDAMIYRNMIDAITND